MVYVLANAVDAGLVPSAAEWPGLISDPAQILHGGVEVPRPDCYFDRRGKMPEKVKLELTRPPGFDDLSDTELVELIRHCLAHREAQIRAEMKAKGKRFLGAKAVLRQDWRASPNTPAPRRNLHPHIAARDRETRILALERLTTFRCEYRLARRNWIRGKRKTLFPAGTYWMRVVYGVRCHPPP